MFWLCFHGYPMALKNEVESLKAFLWEQKNRVFCFKSDNMQKDRQLRTEWNIKRRGRLLQELWITGQWHLSSEF